VPLPYLSSDGIDGESPGPDGGVDATILYEPYQIFQGRSLERTDKIYRGYGAFCQYPGEVTSHAWAGEQREEGGATRPRGSLAYRGYAWIGELSGYLQSVRECPCGSIEV